MDGIIDFSHMSDIDGSRGLRQMIIEYILDQKFDEQGNLEQFSSDGWLVLPQASTGHLNNAGLPSVGDKVRPGMLLIAKFGATKSYRRDAIPNDFEQLTEDEETLIERYKHMFYDASFYVPEGVYGKVTEAFIESHGEFKRAVVRIEKRVVRNVKRSGGARKSSRKT